EDGRDPREAARDGRRVDRPGQAADVEVHEGEGGRRAPEGRLSMSGISGRPGADEHAPYYGKYIALVEGHDAVAALELSTRETESLLRSITEERSHHRYAAEKWSLREVFVHITDVERVFGYRALRVARGDETPLEGFDPDSWMHRAGADARQ